MFVIMIGGNAYRGHKTPYDHADYNYLRLLAELLYLFPSPPMIKYTSGYFSQILGIKLTIKSIPFLKESLDSMTIIYKL
jgi:hypothetical protein